MKEQAIERSGEKTVHPLQIHWNFYHMNGNDKEDWLKRFRVLNLVRSVEDFWSTVNYLRPPSCLQLNCAYVLFKEGVKPMWEDPENENGGRWLIQMDRSYDAITKDALWLSVLLHMIGNDWSLQDPEWCDAVKDWEIMSPAVLARVTSSLRGVFYDQRSKGDRISLWTSDGNDTRVNLLIGLRIHEKLRCNMTLLYQTCADINKRVNSTPIFSMEINTDLKPSKFSNTFAQRLITAPR